MFTRGKTIELASSGSFKAFKNKTEKKEKNENFFSEILNLLRISRNLYQYKKQIRDKIATLYKDRTPPKLVGIMTCPNCKIGRAHV